MRMSSPFRCVCLVLMIAAAGLPAGRFHTIAFAQETAHPPTHILVELFTSEGCSDCPPADELLAKLDEQPAPGVQIIVLSEHVAYWNHKGWDDPYALELVDERQKEYQERFKLESVYTPQMVVDGTTQFVGNSGNALNQTMNEAMNTPKQPLEISQAAWDKSGVHFAVRAPQVQGEHLFAAIAEDVKPSQVNGGENKGRTLHHVAVMRTMKEFKSNFADGQGLSIPASGVEKGLRTRLIVFLEDPHSGHVVGAAETILTRE